MFDLKSFVFLCKFLYFCLLVFFLLAITLEDNQRQIVFMTSKKKKKKKKKRYDTETLSIDKEYFCGKMKNDIDNVHQKPKKRYSEIGLSKSL